MAQFKDMKIRIKDSEHSEAVQECLFELGYGWLGGKKFIPFLPSSVYTYGTGEMNQSGNGYDDYDHFNQHRNEEVTLEQLQEMLAE